MRRDGASLRAGWIGVAPAPRVGRTHLDQGRSAGAGFRPHPILPSSRPSVKWEGDRSPSRAMPEQRGHGPKVRGFRDSASSFPRAPVRNNALFASGLRLSAIGYRLSANGLRLPAAADGRRPTADGYHRLPASACACGPLARANLARMPGNSFDSQSPSPTGSSLRPRPSSPISWRI